MAHRRVLKKRRYSDNHFWRLALSAVCLDVVSSIRLIVVYFLNNRRWTRHRRSNLHHSGGLSDKLVKYLQASSIIW